MPSTWNEWKSALETVKRNEIVKQYVQSDGYAVLPISIEMTFDEYFGQETAEFSQLQQTILDHNNKIADARCVAMNWNGQDIINKYGFMSREANAYRFHKRQTEVNPIDQMTPEEIDTMMVWCD